MPDIHVPKLDEHSGKSIFKLALEVAMIGVGVFLGLAGEQWRERAHQRELAHEALRRFRTEISENRKAVADVKDYHLTTEKALDAVFSKPVRERSLKDVHMQGIRPPRFDHSAWDLAIATQSLTYIDSDLALSLSAIYNVQSTVAGMSQGVIQSMYITPPIDEKSTLSLWGAILIYYNDMVIYEPRLLRMYDEALQQIDKALGEKPK